jgi:hypothetical protein
LNPDNADVKRPVKKQKQKELLPEEKEFNRKISSNRVKVEHAIGQCKIHFSSKIIVFGQTVYKKISGLRIGKKDNLIQEMTNSNAYNRRALKILKKSA